MDSKQLENWINKRRQRRNSRSVDGLFAQLIAGDRVALSECITLVESSLERDKKQANELVQLCLPYEKKAVRIGITGVPGVGKSTFIEAFGKILVKEGKKVAVLAIDPSSAASGGSILGDKTRMEELSNMEDVYIRPSAAGKTLGGVARKTRESILLCEAAGFDIVLVETVGVGQSETLAHSMVDFFLLLMLAGAGDELQGIKRGIMEMADALVITKADGDNLQKASAARREYANAMHLFPPKPSKWTAPALTCSVYMENTVSDVWTMIQSFILQVTQTGWLTHHRKLQDSYWLNEALKELLIQHFYGDEYWVSELHAMEKRVVSGEISSFRGAEMIYTSFQGAIAQNEKMNNPKRSE
jgi:LAO/AO transport system kinase